MREGTASKIVRADRVFLRDIAIVLFFKLAALMLLWTLFFGPTHTVVVTPAKVNAALFSPPPRTTTSKPRS